MPQKMTQQTMPIANPLVISDGTLSTERFGENGVAYTREE